MRLSKKILSVIASATLLISLGACSSTHEARLPSDCNIPSLKALLPTLDLMYKDKPGNQKFLECSTLPLDKKQSSVKSKERQWAEGTSIWYSKGDEGSLTDAEIAQYNLEVVPMNGCKVVTWEEPGRRVTALAWCKGFVIQVWSPDKTPRSFALELASAAIVGLVQ
jgi:hypothetical protein